MRDLAPDPRIRNIRVLCGFWSPIYEMWAMRSWSGGVDLYCKTMEQPPLDVFEHYRLHVAEPSDWWRARGFNYIGMISMPEWSSQVVARLEV